MANHERRDLWADVDERRSRREDGTHQQPHRNGDLKACVVVREQDAGGPDGVKREETARRHERKGQEQDACITPPIGSLACRIADNEGHGTRDPEDGKVKPVVLEVWIEMRAKQQRDKPDQRQRSGEDSGGDDGRRSRSLSKRGRRATAGIVLSAEPFDRCYRSHSQVRRKTPAIPSRHSGDK